MKIATVIFYVITALEYIYSSGFDAIPRQKYSQRIITNGHNKKYTNDHYSYRRISGTL